jgi:predicted negative regulator of RcsB-dependent stress response
MYTNLSLALNLLFLLYLLGISDRPDGAKLFFCGIFLGICVITQGSILLFGVIAVAWIISRSTKDRPLLVKRMLVFLSGLLIVIAATTLRNHLSENDFVPVAGNLGFNFYSGNNPQSTGTFFSPENITLNQEDMFRDSRIIAEAAEGKKLKTSRASAFWMRKSMDYAYHNPLDFSRKFIKKIFLLFSPKEYVHDIEYNLISLRSVALKIMFKDMKYIMPFVLIGLFIGIKELKKNALLYLYIVTFVFSIAVFFVTARYRLMLVPVFMIFAAVAIDRFICYFRSRQWRSLKILCVIWIGVFIVLNYTNLFALPIKTGANTAAFEYHMVNALTHEKNNDYSPALLELEQASRLEPYNRRAISRQGLIYFKLGKLDMAVKCYQMAIKASPLSVDAYFNLGLIYNQQARFAEAKEMLFKAISLDPYDFKAHFELGRAFAAANDKKMAKDEFDLALKYINRWRKLDIEIINRESAAL